MQRRRCGHRQGELRISPDLLTVRWRSTAAGSRWSQLNAALDRSLASSKAALLPLRVMERPADLKAVMR
jgi:hypothetical protein